LVLPEIFEPEESAGFAHGLVNRLAEFAAVNHLGSARGEQPERARQVLLHEPVAGSKRLAVLAVDSLGVFGESCELALDMLGRVGTDDETIVRQLDRRGK